MSRATRIKLLEDAITFFVVINRPARCSAGGLVGSDVMAGVLSSSMSFMAALLVTSATILVCTPLLYLGRPRP